MREVLVRYRNDTRITQEKVAEMVGISRSYYALIELGLRNPSYGLAKKIASVLNKDAEEIFFNIDDFKMKQQTKPADDQAATTEPGPKPAA